MAKGYIIDRRSGEVERYFSTLAGARRSYTAMKRQSPDNAAKYQVAGEEEYRNFWLPFGNELVETVNQLTGKTLMIERRYKGTHMDPATERYHSM